MKSNLICFHILFFFTTAHFPHENPVLLRLDVQYRRPSIQILNMFYSVNIAGAKT